MSKSDETIHPDHIHSHQKFEGGMASTSLNHILTAVPENIQEVAATNLCLLETFYVCVRNQAERSFICALVAAAAGCIFFLIAVAFLAVSGDKSSMLPQVSLISGALVQVIAGINFYLYGRTSAQLASFHVYLDRTQRFLLANSVCAQLNESSQQTARAELVRQISTAEMRANNSARTKQA